MTTLGAAGARAWARVPPNDGSCRVRLFCAPWAGGGASAFGRWQEGLPRDVHVCPVQLPGRQNRIAEPVLKEIGPVVHALAEVIAACDDVPFALFGHSMGGLIVFELARYLRRTGAQTPDALVASGCRAPHLQSGTPVITHLPDSAFLAAMRGFSGLPAEMFAQPELLELMLPSLRGDIALCEAYRYTPEAPLDCPVFAYRGSSVGDVSFDRLSGWQTHTTGSFRMRTFPGAHFFIEESRADVLAALAADLDPIRGR